MGLDGVVEVADCDLMVGVPGEDDVVLIFFSRLGLTFLFLLAFCHHHSLEVGHP